MQSTSDVIRSVLPSRCFSFVNFMRPPCAMRLAAPLFNSVGAASRTLLEIISFPAAVVYPTPAARK